MDIVVKYHAEVAIVVVTAVVVVVVIVTVVVVVVVILEAVGTVTVEQQHQWDDSTSPPFRLRYSTSVPYLPSLISVEFSEHIVKVRSLFVHPALL